MRRPKERIPIESRTETIDQYAWFDDGEIFRNHDRYAIAIGKFVIAFSGLESCLDSTLANAIDDNADYAGYRIIKHLAFGKKVELLREDKAFFIKMCLRGRRAQKNLLALKIICDRLAELGEFRNKVAHARWVTLDRDGYVRVKVEEDPKDGGTCFRKTKMTPGIIVKFTRRCGALAARIENFTEVLEEDLSRR
jgi:hypothetical protein